MTFTYHREHEALLAIVGHDHWIDFRATPIGESGQFAQLATPS